MNDCRHRSGRRSRLRFPEPTPPGVNYLILSGTLARDPWRGRNPIGDPVVFLRIEFPVADPDRPQVLRAWASCEVEVAAELAERQEVEARPRRRSMWTTPAPNRRWPGARC
jgi:hypothetical protein